MSVTSVAALVDLLRNTSVLQPAQLQLVATDLETEYTDPRAAVEMLMRRKWLTPFQSEQLLSEHGSSLVLGPYILLEPLGEGGMGMVYKARHTLLDRVVALKIIRGERISTDPEAVRRFQREARAAALLSHPHIVMVYDMGVADNNYFIAMEYIDGTDLGRWVKETGPLPVAQACDFIRQAALGLQSAHEAGLVHRDIKPSNLLASGLRQRMPTKGISAIGAGPAVPGQRVPPRLTRGYAAAPERTTVPSAPIIKILDMGLVRLCAIDGERSANSSLTQEGSIVGTPDYIAPEQARNARRVDIRADLYSLGCTFYYLLTGQPPFNEGSPIEKLLMHQLDEPTPVARHRPEVSPGVAMVVHKLMAKFPRDRYQSPAELAEVLTKLTATAAPSKPERDTKKPETRTAPLGMMRTPAPPAPAVAPVQPPTPPVAAERPQAPARSPADDGVEWRGIKTPPPEELLTAAAYDKAAANALTGVESAKRIASLQGHAGCTASLAFSTDRDTLASGAVDGTLCIWDFRGSKPRERATLQKHRDAVHSLAFAPDGQVLASGSGAVDGLIWLWNMAEEKPGALAFLKGHQGPVDGLAFALDGKLIVSGGQDHTVRVWEFVNRQAKPRTVLKGHLRPVKDVAFAPDGQHVASASLDATVRLWSIGRMWSKERAVLPHPGEVHAVAFSPNGRHLASACQDQVVRVWDVSDPSNPKGEAVLRGHTGVIRRVVIAADGQTIISVGDDYRVLVWQLDTGTQLREWHLSRSLNNTFAVTVDGRYLANGSSDGPVNVYRIAEKRPK